jgi:two-component system OmpR family sensor kinase
MFLKSIRWRLQVWYGLLLLVVLAGFGLTAHQLQRGKLFRRVDEEIARRLGELDTALRNPPRPPMDGSRPGSGPGPVRPGLPPRGPGGRPFPGDRFQGVGGEDFRPEGPPDGFSGPPREFHLPPRQAALFDETDPNGFYYLIWTRDGKLLAHSTNAPAELAMPAAALAASLVPRLRGECREMFHATPPGEVLLAGRSVAAELNDLRRTAARLGAAGAVILLLGLAGGWWLATGAIRPIQDISAAAVKIASGDLSHRIDITDTDNELGRLAGVLNSTFTRLEAAFAQQQQFTSDAAHELRTPVSVMLTQTQTALNRERSAPEYRETLEACQRAAQRMRRLLEALLELARLDAGQEPMKRSRFDLSRTARDCVELIRPLAEEKKVAVRCELPPLECTGDSERLSQVITNLLTNAINYNRPNGQVEITGETNHGSTLLNVTDTGQGIPSDQLPRLFDRFYRVDKSRSTGGSGLGLAISKAIVVAHGGTIEVISQPGEGTTFSVRLPN